MIFEEKKHGCAKTCSGWEDGYTKGMAFMKKELGANQLDFKAWGSDGCTECEPGRITLYYLENKCVSCQHDSTREAEVTSKESK